MIQRVWEGKPFGRPRMRSDYQARSDLRKQEADLEMAEDITPLVGDQFVFQ